MLNPVVGDMMDYGYEEYDSDPELASILSISDNRPAEVTIGWMTGVANGCSGATGVSAKRDGNNIYLAIKTSQSTGAFFTCTQAVEDKYGAFTVKNLEVGEYIIRGHHYKKELGRFRIEPDTAYSNYYHRTKIPHRRRRKRRHLPCESCSTTLWLPQDRL